MALIPTRDGPVEIRQFVERVRHRLDNVSGARLRTLSSKQAARNSPGTATDPYTRYIEAHEVQISPRHNALQSHLERFLGSAGFTDIRPDVAGVDLRFRNPAKGLVLAEVKPCDLENVRFAIRTAIGQLLDYGQREAEAASLLVVLDRKPTEEDQLLAIGNGFGIAYPRKQEFIVVWPNRACLSPCSVAPGAPLPGRGR